MQPTHLFNNFYARTQIKVVSIAQDYVYTDVFELFWCQGFNRALTGYGQESRCWHYAVTGNELSQACLCLRTGLYYCEMLVYSSNSSIY